MCDDNFEAWQWVEGRRRWQRQWWWWQQSGQKRTSGWQTAPVHRMQFFTSHFIANVDSFKLRMSPIALQFRMRKWNIPGDFLPFSLWIGIFRNISSFHCCLPRRWWPFLNVRTIDLRSFWRLAPITFSFTPQHLSRMATVACTTSDPMEFPRNQFKNNTTMAL